MSTKVVINESPQYKLSVTDGTDQTLSVTNGIELQVTANVGGQGPAGPNEITTVTGTNLNGYIYGNGTNVGGATMASTFLVAEEVNTLVLRDTENRIYAKQLRLTDGTTKYGQINHPAFQPSDSSFSYTLPRASGTIALSTTALMLTGTQTASGAKIFLGQVELQGQSENGGYSALNVNLGDARYGAVKSISDSPVTSITTNFVTVVEITLDVGLYQIDAFLASLHHPSYGCKIRFGASANIKTGVTDNYGRPSVAAFSWPIIDDAYNNSSPYAIRSDSGAVEYRRTITGIVEILTANTTLRLDYAQLNASAVSPSTARTRAHILARKIN